MTIRSTITAIATVAAIVTGISATVQARTISLDGYDLSSVQDVDRLHREIVSTVKQECGRELRKGYYAVRRAKIQQCVRDAVDLTINDAGLPMLSRLHASTAEEYRYSAKRPSMVSNTLAAQ